MSEENLIEKMKDYESPIEEEPIEEDVIEIKHRKHLELSKVISAHQHGIRHVMSEIDVIETFIGKEKLCPIRKQLLKIKAQEEFINEEIKQLESLEKELDKIRSEL